MWETLLPLLGSAVSSIFGANAQADATRAQVDASRYGVDKNYDIALRQLQQLQDARNTGAKYGAMGESQLMQSLSAPPQEMQSYIDAFTRNSLPQQQEAMSQFRSTLSQNNVRGSRASTLANRQYGQYNNQLNENIQRIAMQNAMDRANQRSGFYANKATMGYGGAMR